MQLPIDRLRPTRLPEQVASKIESFILSFQLREGDKLPSERELGARFGVSRTVVRESIKFLEQRGLLESQNGRGIFVTSPGLAGVASSLSDAYRLHGYTPGQLYQVRRCLESTIAREAAIRATSSDIARMEAAVEAIEANFDDPEKAVPADVEFHVAVAAATQNPLFVAIVQPLVELIHEVGVMGFRVDGGLRSRHQGHKRLLECIKNGDAAGAEEAIQRHLTVSLQAVEEYRAASSTTQDCGSAPS